MNALTNQIKYKLLTPFLVEDEPYPSAVARFAEGMRSTLNKKDKTNPIPRHAMMFVCESEQFMAQLAQELVKLNSKIKLSLNTTEEDLGEQAKYVEEFRKQYPNNVCKTSLHDAETYETAVVLVMNSVYGSYLSALNKNSTNLLFICTEDLKDQRDLALGCSSKALDRLLSVFFKGKQVIITHTLNGNYQPLLLKSELNENRNDYIRYLSNL